MYLEVRNTRVHIPDTTSKMWICGTAFSATMKTVGLVGCCVVVVLWCVVCELPTSSLASQARVYCGYRPGPTREMLPPRQGGGDIRAPALACVLAVACCIAYVVASVAGGFVV